MTNCFVIMPFGDRKDAEGKVTEFDTVYEYIIEKAVDAAGLKSIRCDKIEASGSLHEMMISNIFDAKVAVVDITNLNPNVFYELGVRHALADRVTVIIRREGTQIPFNIHGMNAIEYEPTRPASVDNAIKKITSFIKNGMEKGEVDSLVQQILPVKIATEAQPIKEYAVYRYNAGAERVLGIVAGDITNVTFADVWVNSENTNMIMARYLERSISSVIRYHGAKKKRSGLISEDTIADALRAAMDGDDSVPPGTVIPTTAGDLEKSHNVKRIFHAASVVGQPTLGFTPIQDPGHCVTNALVLADSEDMRDAKIRSLLFPLFGMGQGRGQLEDAYRLISCAYQYLQNHPNSGVKEIYFMSRTDKELEACRAAIKMLDLQAA
jgi:hypothetical protein